MSAAKSGCWCYSRFVMAAQRKQLSMAWNSLRGKSCTGRSVASAPWKELVTELQTLQASSTSHSSSTGLQQIFWHQIKPSCFILPPTNFWLDKWPHASGIFLHSELASCILLTELDPTNSLLNSVGYLWGSAACWQALSIDSGRAHKPIPWNNLSKPRCKPFFTGSFRWPLAERDIRGLSQDAHKKPGLSIRRAERRREPFVVQRPGSRISSASCGGGSWSQGWPLTGPPPLLTTFTGFDSPSLWCWDCTVILR